MSEANGNGADVDVSIAGQQVKLKNIKSLNTLATVATLVICAVGFVALYQIVQAHTQDTRDAGKAFVEAIREQTSAVKEQTVAAREQNCLIAMPIERRDPELCRRLSR